jgi:hypothetical protein
MKEINQMRKKNIIQIAMLTAVLVGAFIVFRSAASAGSNNSGKESVDECCKKKNAGQADKMIWENLSRQFFSSI